MFKEKLIKITEWEYEIPMQGEMKVPGKIFSSTSLLKDLDERSLAQVADVACLPGIQKYAIATSDMHIGYGFPIGGVAAFDPEEGVVSVGGVGFDGGCLSGDSKVLHELGYTKPFSSFENDWKKQKIKCCNPNHIVKNTSISNFIKWKKYNKVFKVRTEAGHEVIATEDHPFLTPKGMTFLRDLGNEPISVFPFEGVVYEEAENKIIIREEDILGLPLLKNKKQTINELKKRNLLPLKLNNEKLPYLIKIFGFNLGDGTAYFSKNKGTLWFYGKPEDLEDIQKDIDKIGFRASKIYSRQRKHSINTKYKKVEFENIEYSIKTTSSALAALFMALELPFNNKTKQNFNVPGWIINLKLWQKRLFLASFFGAELTTPKTASDNEYNFSCPLLSMDKSEGFQENGKDFLSQISGLLKEFKVKSNLIEEREEYINKKNEKSIRLRLLISSEPKSLINLWSNIGFEYNKKRRYLANVAVQYLKLKQRVLEERKRAIRDALNFKKSKISAKKAYAILKNKYKWINFRFIERTFYGGRKTSPRIAYKFIKFNNFLEKATNGLGKTGQVWDKVIFRKEIPWNDFVYDFTVEDENHNFIANNFVVSNCGVRALKTNLKLDEVKPKIKELIDELFRIVPAGLGIRGKIVLKDNEVNEVLKQGAKWVVERGYGTEEDLEFIEDNGSIKGAIPEAVSQLAIKREKKQVGTLGSGNHYLEVMYVDEIYDEKAAKELGLEKNQIMVWVHCGSRALGHQIGTDYLKILAEASRKYNIPIRDRELVCAPINSEEGKKYFGAMCCALNYAHANRQVIVHLIRQGIEKVFPKAEVKTFYEISHNSCKAEKHSIDGKEKIVYVHRKGATRAFGPGREEVPKAYRKIGQPVLIGGTMGTSSYILHGTEEGSKAFFSSCHGAGRAMSRTQALKNWHGDNIIKELQEKGIYVKCHSFSGLAEEAPDAYKPVEEVVDSIHNAGLARKVCKLRPIGNIKG